MHIKFILSWMRSISRWRWRYNICICCRAKPCQLRCVHTWVHYVLCSVFVCPSHFINWTVAHSNWAPALTFIMGQCCGAFSLHCKIFKFDKIEKKKTHTHAEKWIHKLFHYAIGMQNSDGLVWHLDVFLSYIRGRY